MYAQLGTTIFSGMLGFSELSQNKTANFAEHALINSKSKLQRIGKNLDEVKLAINLHASFSSPEAEIGKLTTHFENGDVIPFFNGAGDVMGDFVITELEVVYTTLFPQDGRIQEATVSVTLKEFFAENLIKSREDQKKATAFAGPQSTAVPAEPVSVPQSDQAAASASVDAGCCESQNIFEDYQSLEAEPTNMGPFANIRQSLDKMRKSFTRASNKINLLSADLSSQLTGLYSDLQSAQIIINQLDGFAGAQDLVNFAPGVATLKNNMVSMRKNNAPLAAIMAARR